MFGACPKPGQIGRVAAGMVPAENWRNNGGGGINGPDRVASSWIASIIFLMPLKSQNDVFWYRPTQVDRT